MSAECFLDTNILIYRFSEQDAQKRIIAANLLGSENAMISVQVLNEFCNTIRRKFPDKFQQVEATLSEIGTLVSVADLKKEDTMGAVQISRRYGFSYYDSLILASAQRHGCKAVFSEDMQHEMVLDSGLQILNPFSL